MPYAPRAETLPFRGVSDAPKCEFEALRTSHGRLRIEVAASRQAKGGATVGVAPGLDTRRWRGIACIGRGLQYIHFQNQKSPHGLGFTPTCRRPAERPETPALNASEPLVPNPVVPVPQSEVQRRHSVARTPARCGARGQGSP